MAVWEDIVDARRLETLSSVRNQASVDAPVNHAISAYGVEK